MSHYPSRPAFSTLALACWLFAAAGCGSTTSTVDAETTSTTARPRPAPPPASPRPALDAHGIESIFALSIGIARPAQTRPPEDSPVEPRARLQGQGRVVVTPEGVFLEAPYDRGEPLRARVGDDRAQALLDELARLRDAIALPDGEDPVSPGAHDFPHLRFEGSCPIATGVRCYVGVAHLPPELTSGPWVDYNRAVRALMDRVLAEVERAIAQ